MGTDSPASMGKGMAIIAWLLGLALLTQFFASWEENQENPNAHLSGSFENGIARVTLEGNRRGHYRTPGLINGQAADFIVDTGATDVVIPAGLSGRYGLESLGDGLALTANGYVALQKTEVRELSIGPIKLYNVRASLNPAMDTSQPILLGMSALAHIEIQQSQGIMTLIKH